jgi:hypothetical protein
MPKKNRGGKGKAPGNAKKAPSTSQGKSKPPKPPGIRIPREATTPTPSEEEEAYKGTTDVDEVTGPVLSLVHERMRDAWEVHGDRPMWLVFDAVNPVRQFKRDMPYNARVDFPDYDSDALADLTETDEGGAGLMPYQPITHR